MNCSVFDSNRIRFRFVTETIVFQRTKQFRSKQFFAVADNRLTIDDIDCFDFDKLNSEINKKYNFETIKIVEKKRKQSDLTTEKIRFDDFVFVVY